jgi:hypothetical protein
MKINHNFSMPGYDKIRNMIRKGIFQQYQKGRLGDESEISVLFYPGSGI